MFCWVVLLISAAVLASFAAGTARADRRHFAWTYEPQLLKRGEAELESYTTFVSDRLKQTRGRTAAEMQFELETGMTDRFDFAIYQVFAQDPGEPFYYEGYKLRFRYRVAADSRFSKAPIAYVEYEGRPDFSTDAVETKVILGRDFGSLRLALNPGLEIEQEGGEWEAKAQYAAGLTWRLSEMAACGVEAKGDADAHFLGPVISHGVEGLWVTLGALIRLNDADSAPELQTRMLLGLKVH